MNRRAKKKIYRKRQKPRTKYKKPGQSTSEQQKPVERPNLATAISKGNLAKTMQHNPLGNAEGQDKRRQQQG